MTQDLEMKDRSTPSNSISPPVPSTLQHLKEIASLIETGSYSKEVRRIARAVRLTIALRKKLTASVISSFLDHVLSPGSEPHAKLSAYLPKEDDH
jgi:26S proteasome regulatory subunit N3